MKEPILKRKFKIDQNTLRKYTYVAVIAFILVLGVSYGFTFFIQNKKVVDETLSVGDLSVTVSDGSLSLRGLTPLSDEEALLQEAKELIISNTTSINGEASIKIVEDEENTGMTLTDLRYALFVKDARYNSYSIVDIQDVPASGLIYKTAVLPDEDIYLKVNIWPKQSYQGGSTSFDGELDVELSLKNILASSFLDEVGLTNNYVWFNCNTGYNSGTSYCTKYRIVDVDSERVIITDDTNGASERVDSGKFITVLSTGKDESLITSVSSDTNHKNLYLLKTTVITGGDGTSDSPYILDNETNSIQDRKVLATIDYQDNSVSVNTQPIYSDYTNYISYMLDDLAFKSWTDSNEVYLFGEEIEFNSDTTLTPVKGNILYGAIKDKYEDTVTYVKSYTTDVLTSNPTFTSQDTVGTNNRKREVYYYTGSDAKANGNVLFGGYCWQIVRTTDNGGVRLIYNGPAENDKCLEGRSPSKQFSGTANKNADGNLNFKNQSFSYANSFSYDEGTNTFSLNNPYTATWSDNDSNSDGEADYKALIGTYTCRGGNSCQTIYYVGHHQENGEPSYATYTLASSTNTGLVSGIGTSPFNAYSDSPNLIGYMYNGGVNVKSETITAETMETLTFGNNVVYENGVYTLSETNTGIANDRHYRCEINDANTETATTCQTVKYYYQVDGTTYYFIRLNGGKTIESEMKEMFNYKALTSESDTNINRYSSAIKGLLDNWYFQKLSTYSSYLDKEIVYCNNRNTLSYAGWLRDGSAATNIIYGGSVSNADLNCMRISDRLSVNNDTAKLTYPISLLTEQERYLMQAGYAASGINWWLISPNGFNAVSTNANLVSGDGSADNNAVSSSYTVRPVITIKPGVVVDSGNGSYATPYVIDTTN